MSLLNQELHRITSTAIIFKDGKFLITRRSLDKKAFPGKWTVPGGGLETNDYLNLAKTTSNLWYFAVENSLRREIKEEVNLEVGKIEYLLDITFIRPDGTPAVILSFYCPYLSGEVKLDHESIDYVWATCEEAKNYDLIDGLWEEIEMVDKILKGEKAAEYGKKTETKVFSQKEFNDFVIENNVYGFFQEPLTLKSGRQSHFYVNWRNVVEDVYLTDKLADFVLSFVKEKGIEADSFYGIPDGATKLALITQYKWAKQNKDFGKGSHSLAMGRKIPKEHGETKNRYFLGAPAGKTAVIEDVTTTGDSLLSSIEILQNMGIEIVAAITLTNRMEKRNDGWSVQEIIEQKGIKFYSLSSALELLPTAYQKIKPERKIGQAIEKEFKEYGMEKLDLGLWTIFTDYFSRELNEKGKAARSKVCLALDNLETIEELEERIKELKPAVGMFKIGKELFTKFGPEAVKIARAGGVDVFYDSKFCDILNTVKAAAKAATQLGVAIFNVHCSGGLAMLKAAAEGARQASAEYRLPLPKIIGVTVLTSINQEIMNRELGIEGKVNEQVLRLAKLAQQAGLDGVVCSGEELEMLRQEFPADFMLITPGIRLATDERHDQKRILTPGQAVQDGADLLVVGRAITEKPTAEERLNAAYEILEEIAEQLF